MDNDLISRKDAVRILQDARERGGFDLRGLIAEVRGLPAATSSSQPARAAAEEIANRWINHDLPTEASLHSLSLLQLQALAEHVITKHFPAAAAPVESEMPVEPTAGADGRYCRHHDDDPAHGKECYQPDVETEHERLRRTFAYERVRFHHDPNNVYLVVNITDDNMLELEGMAGAFAPSLFKRVGGKDTTPFVTAPVVATGDDEGEEMPSDVDHLLFKLAAQDCQHLAAGMRDCTEELAFADWCPVCQSRGLLQKYSRMRDTAALRTPVEGESK